MSADWNRIKTEYITTDISCRKLAEKYGVSESTLFKKCSKEQWEALRKQHGSTVEAKTLAADAKRKIDRAARLKTVADKLLNKIEQAVDEDGLMSAGAIKNLSEALKNIQQAQMLRTERDDREQDARIAKLQKEAQDQDKSKTITVTLEGDLNRYAQ